MTIRLFRSGLVSQLLLDEDGQDLVEYALLCALIGIAATLVWQQLVTTVRDVYIAADTAIQDTSGCTPDPGGGGC